jgi:hypothetical protein
MQALSDRSSCVSFFIMHRPQLLQLVGHSPGRKNVACDGLRQRSWANMFESIWSRGPVIRRVLFAF